MCSDDQGNDSGSCSDVVILSFSLFSSLSSPCSVGNFVPIPSFSPSTLLAIISFWSRHSSPSLNLSSQPSSLCLTYSFAHASPILSYLHCPSCCLGLSRSGIRSTDTRLALHQNPLPSTGEWRPTLEAIYHANGADYSDVRGMPVFWELSDIATVVKLGPSPRRVPSRSRQLLGRMVNPSSRW